MLEQEHTTHNSQETIAQLTAKVSRLEKEKELLIQYIQKRVTLANGEIDWRFSSECLEELLKTTKDED